MRECVIEYDDIVIGSSLDAMMHAFIQRCPIFFTTPMRPFRFSYLAPETDLACLKLPTPTGNKSLTTFGQNKKIGIAEELLWERLFFLLSLSGNAPLSNLCHSMRYDDRRVVCSNEYSKIFEFSFKSCYYFGDSGTSGMVREKSFDEDTYICYDYIAFNKGGKHEIDYIHTGDDFVSEIWFYPSDRIDGNTPVRDACAVSKLTREQLISFDFSETMARFKVVHEMENRGMKGVFAHAYTKSGKPKHYNFRTTSIGRQTCCPRNSYEPQSENIKIAEADTASLLRDLPQACVAYDRFLRNW
jgi:hypothetical protein